MNAYSMSLKDWLDDLCVRFIVNLPKEELESIERICFQIEEAQWFYEDFVRPLDAQLPSLNLKQFCMLIFQNCSLFAGWNQDVYTQAFSEFLTYKTRVPVRGAIMLNEAMDHCVLVKGWKKSANWSFPRGKINKGEADLACAIREVYEETGFDIQEAGLIPKDDNDVKSIEITMREQHMKLFVFHGVPMETHFQPRTRKEISNIQWYRLSDLPTLKKNPKQQIHNQQNQAPHDTHGENLASHANKFYMVAPFMPHLKKYIAVVRKRNAVKQQAGLQPAYLHEQVLAAQHDGSIGDMASGATQADHMDDAQDPSDMARLMMQLRQSSQAARDQNLPEVMSADTSLPDTSAQLRAMLNMPGSQANIASPSPNLLSYLHPRPSEPHSRQADQHPHHMSSHLQPSLPVPHNPSILSQSQSLGPQASLLHGQYPFQGSGMTQTGPQTPLDQMFSQNRMPPSPKHQHRAHQTPAGLTGAPPPAFAYSPAQPRLATSSPQPPVSSAPTPVQSAWPNTGPQPPITRARSPAPYQQSSDPMISGTPQTVPTVPEPSRLPPPKLNANSVRLLSLFKPVPSSNAAEMSADSLATQETANTHLSSSLGSSYTVAARPGSSQLRGLGPPAPIFTKSEHLLTSDLASPTELGPSSPTASRPRTSQQSALLDLFKSQPSRTPSGTARGSGTLSPALAPAPAIPTVPAEFSSASNAILASLKPTDQRRSGSREALAPALAPSTRGAAEKKAISHTPLPSMSATVSGPLQVTEKDFHKPSVNNTLTPGTVKILSRPGTAGGNGAAKGLEVNNKLASPKPSRSPRRRPETKQVQASPKVFQPQILKRPVEPSNENVIRELQTYPAATSAPQILRRDTDLPSPMSRQTSAGTPFDPASAVTPALADGLDRRASQAGEQKAALLSLFQRNSLQPVVSPIGSLPRTRLGSLASTGSGEAGRTTPQTSEKDKKFLLGFLNNVVNEGR